MSIQGIVIARGITEVLHFTTNSGLTGILASKSLKARSLLAKDQYLEHIYRPNCADRSRDAAWHGYVNLSISAVNSRLFGISAGNWHRDIDGWWSILSFRPEIMAHEGVYFTSTNNMYSGVERSCGKTGLEALFAPSIEQWVNKIVVRANDLPASHPTCQQAEVLYPSEIPLQFLQRIYVRDGEHADQVAALYSATGFDPVEVQVDQSRFC